MKMLELPSGIDHEGEQIEGDLMAFVDPFAVKSIVPYINSSWNAEAKAPVREVRGCMVSFGGGDDACFYTSLSAVEVRELVERARDARNIVVQNVTGN